MSDPPAVMFNYTISKKYSFDYDFTINHQYTNITSCRLMWQSYEIIYMSVNYNLRPGVCMPMQCPMSDVNFRRQTSLLNQHFDDSLI